MLLFVPEVGVHISRWEARQTDCVQTTYRRQASVSVTRGSSHEEVDFKKTHSLSDFDPNAASPNQATFFSQLKIYNGTFSDERLWSIFFRPFPLILSPVVRVVRSRTCISSLFPLNHRRGLHFSAFRSRRPVRVRYLSSHCCSEREFLTSSATY